MPLSVYRTALITGASAGLGAEYARQLAAAKTNLILVARRLERLEALARELEKTHGISVETVQADVSRDEDVGRLESLIAGNETLDLLINNAGFGGRTGFVRGELEAHLHMVQVHVNATVRLARAAVPGMISRGRGAMINIASVAAFSPFSGAMYSGTKSFLVMFSENLQSELKAKGVVVQALCPGLTHTEFHAVADLDLSSIPGTFWMAAEDVVRVSLRRLGHGVICIPGWKNRAIAFLMRCPLTAGGLRALARSRLVRKKSEGHGPPPSADDQRPKAGR